MPWDEIKMQELSQLREFCFYFLSSKQKVLGKKSHVGLLNISANKNLTLKLITLSVQDFGMQVLG